MTAEQSFKELISNINIEQYKDILNPAAWSGADAESFIVMLLLLFAVYKFLGRAYKFVGWCIGLLIMIDICYMLGQSDLNNYIPFSSVFVYDIGVSVANFFAGTKIASGILWFHEFLRTTIVYVGDLFAKYGGIVFEYLSKLFSEEMPGSVLHRRK